MLEQGVHHPPVLPDRGAGRWREAWTSVAALVDTALVLRWSLGGVTAVLVFAVGLSTVVVACVDSVRTPGCHAQHGYVRGLVARSGALGLALVALGALLALGPWLALLTLVCAALTHPAPWRRWAGRGAGD